MKTTKSLLAILLAGISLAACSKESPRAADITTADKNLSCDELKLEINDAEYIRQTALRNRGLNARNILWPFGYPGTYLSAEEALESADKRIDYLNQVYTIKNCTRSLG